MHENDELAPVSVRSTRDRATERGYLGRCLRTVNTDERTAPMLGSQNAETPHVDISVQKDQENVPE
jgi:hypothetical protein